MTEALHLPKPGEVIGAKYRVERLLGTGGMGAVYEASHRVTGKRFAIKLLLPELTMIDDVVKRFIREAQVAGRFQHPNVVEVYDIGEYTDSFFMVMELLRGESLAAKLARESRIEVATACRILLPCLSGIGAAHAAGIIHRDVKPANIFLCDPRAGAESVPKVLDFGISKLADLPGLPHGTTTDTGTVMGTPFYMAPEQLSSKPIDHRADIYAIGVTLYQLLTGRQPFLASNYAELVIKIWSEVPTPVESLAVDVPPGLAAVIARAMARRAEDRYATTDAMARALAPFAGESARYSSPRVVSVTPQPTDAVLAAAAQPITTPVASETLASPRVRPAQWRTRAVRWALIACAVALAGYAAWRGFTDGLPEASLSPEAETPEGTTQSRPAASQPSAEAPAPAALPVRVDPQAEAPPPAALPVLVDPPRDSLVPADVTQNTPPSVAAAANALPPSAAARAPAPSAEPTTSGAALRAPARPMPPRAVASPAALTRAMEPLPPEPLPPQAIAAPPIIEASEPAPAPAVPDRKLPALSRPKPRIDSNQF